MEAVTVAEESDEVSDDRIRLGTWRRSSRRTRGRSQDVEEKDSDGRDG